MFQILQDMGANGTGTLSLGIIAAVCAAYYFTNMNVLRVGRGRIFFYAGIVASVALAAYTFVNGSQETLRGIGCALLALVVVGAYIWVDLFFSKVGDQQSLKVGVGDHYLDFVTLDGNGNEFRLSEYVDGRPFLLKFYRGWW